MGKVGKWGEMGGNGGIWELWEIAKKIHCGECRKKCVKLVGNGRKIGENWDNLGQNFQFFLVPFPPLFHNLATFPSSSFDEFCQAN